MPIIKKTDENIEVFINMVLLGCSPTEISEEIDISRQTYYDWMDDKNIIKELDRRRHELYTTGQQFIRGRYKKYLENIDKACNDMSDKRSFLQANIYMIDKIDGKANMNITIDDKSKDTIEEAKDLLSKYDLTEEE